MSWIAPLDVIDAAVIAEGTEVTAKGVLVLLDEGFGLLGLGTYLSEVVEDEDADDDEPLTCDVELSSDTIELTQYEDHAVTVVGVWTQDRINVASVIDAGEVDVDLEYVAMAEAYLSLSEVIESQGFDEEDADDEISGVLDQVFPEDQEDSPLTAFGSWVHNSNPLPFITVSHITEPYAKALRAHTDVQFMLVSRVVPDGAVTTLTEASAYIP